jgi:hypothetical protein
MDNEFPDLYISCDFSLFPADSSDRAFKGVLDELNMLCLVSELWDNFDRHVDITERLVAESTYHKLESNKRSIL